MNKEKEYNSWLTLATSHNSINIITFIQIQSRSDYGTEIKNNPKYDKVPDRPNWAPLLIVWKGNVVSS